MERIQFVRLLLVCSIVVSAVPVVSAAWADRGSDALDYERSPHSVATASEVTVVANQGHGKNLGELVVFDGEGRLIKRFKRAGSYWDVDPLPGSPHSVLVVTATKRGATNCPSTTKCTVNRITRLNLSTGSREHLATRIWPNHAGSELHDADLDGRGNLLIADIVHDRAYSLNTTTNASSWSYAFQSTYSLRSGGPYPGDWTHLNDIERLPDGRIMLSPRNHDSVIFVSPAGELQHGWTLGSDDDHEVLYEQHNPDYIPGSMGGPAVIVADSENNRVVEYQREDGSWTPEWVYGGLEWPRDADRLPSGHTLVTESHGDRVVEINEAGEVVWSVTTDFPYEAERLDTPDESGGGTSAAALGLTDAEVAAGSGGDSGRSVTGVIKSAAPTKVVHGLMAVTPRWMGVLEFGGFVVAVGGFVALSAFEFHHRFELVVDTPSIRRR
jgi:hypothetical protein